MAKPNSQPRRVVVALDPMAPDAAALDLAILQHMVREGIHELLGMFVEDVRLLAHARSRLATEVILSGAARPLDIGSLERQMRAKAAEARRHFESAASRLGLPHAFRVARGDVIAELSNVAVTAQVLVIGVAREAAGPRAWAGAAIHQLARLHVPALLFTREGWQRGTTVLAVLEDVEKAARTLRTAVNLATATDLPLRVYLAGEALAHRQDVLAELSEQLAEYGDAGLRSLVSRLDPAAAIHAVQTENARILVLSSPDDDVKTELLRQLLEQTTATVLLVQ